MNPLSSYSRLCLFALSFRTRHGGRGISLKDFSTGRKHRARNDIESRIEPDGMKIRLVMLGKTRRAELRALLDDYLGRIRRHAEIEALELRDSSAALRKFQLDAAATPATMVVLLDAAGKQFTSEQFARWLAGHRDAGTRELIFLCGDAGGFPERCADGPTLSFRFRR